jgi:hypothetical protein
VHAGQPERQLDAQLTQRADQRLRSVLSHSRPP